MASKTPSKHRYHYQYPHPAVTADAVVFGLGEADLQVLLIERRHPPFAHYWAVPGGFVNLNESLEAAARRELAEETGLQNVPLEQFHTFGDPGRDPRERVISVAYFGLVRPEACVLRARSDARAIRWFPVDHLPRLAFDHRQMVARAAQCLREKLVREPLAVALLPEKFKLPQLQRVYEIILGVSLDKRNFRRHFLASGLLVPLGEWDRSARRRPARLYRFDRRKLAAQPAGGFAFPAAMP